MSEYVTFLGRVWRENNKRIWFQIEQTARMRQPPLPREPDIQKSFMDSQFGRIIVVFKASTAFQYGEQTRQCDGGGAGHANVVMPFRFQCLRLQHTDAISGKCADDGCPCVGAALGILSGPPAIASRRRLEDNSIGA